MKGKLKKMKDSLGKYIYPVTRAEAVYVSDNKTLSQKLAEMGNGGGSPTNILSGKVWAVLGDSVTNGGYWDNSTGIETVGTPVKTYHEQIVTNTGIVAVNYGIGGTCITDRGDNTGMCVRYANMRNDADIITVMGGINDYAYAGNTPIGTFGSTDKATIHGAMKILCEGLLQKYPKKPIGFILPFGFNEYKGANTWKPYEDALIINLEYYGIPYLNLRKSAPLNANIDFVNQKYFKFNYGTTTGDKTHPNTIGFEIIAHPIRKFLEHIVG